MRKLFYLLLIMAAVWAAVRYIPSETKNRGLAAIGLDKFFSQTLPRAVRDKLSISADPVRERKKLLDELSGKIAAVESELEIISPPKTDGVPPPLAKPSEIRERIEKTRELLAESEETLEKLEAANPGTGLFQKTAERILDKILPLPEPLAGGGQETGGGLGGDAGGGEASGGAAECACPK